MVSIVVALHAALELARLVRVYENAEGIFLLQDVIRAAADDDAVRFLRKLPEQPVLLGEYLDARLQRRIRQHAEAASDVNRKRRKRAALAHPANVFL